MKKFIAPAIAVLLVAAIAGISQTQPAKRAHHIVFAMNSPEADWSQVFGNLGNIRTAFAGDDVEIEVVCYGKGTELLHNTNAAWKERIEKAIAAGTVFSACRNSMRLRKLEEKDMFTFSQFVDSGTAQVVRRQDQGFALLKSGE